MTEALGLLERWSDHTVRCEYVTEVGWPCTCGFDEAVAYLAMTTCGAVAFIEETRDGAWVVDMGAQEAARQFLEEHQGCREGELVAALERVREQAAYGFTGETLENMKNGMSAREMNGWWMKRIAALCEGDE